MVPSPKLYNIPKFDDKIFSTGENFFDFYKTENAI